MSIRNRLVMPAMGTNYGHENGSVSQRTINYYEARAKGGAGLVISENMTVDRFVSKSSIRMLCIDDYRFLPGLRELAAAVQRHGAKFAVQLHHGGRVAKMSLTKTQPVAPSVIPGAAGIVPRELTTGEIAGIVVHFAASAELAKRAGADGVEIHSAHNNLITQFLCRAHNKRQDAYGGELRNRARLLLEIIGAMKKSCGEDFPVWCRINGIEYGTQDGFTLEESLEVARMAQDAGSDAIHVSSFPIGSWRLPPMAEPPGNIVHLAEAIKQAVSIPVIAVGKITPEVAENVLRDGKADLVAFGKALIADPDLPNKLSSGKQADIIACIGCLNCHNTLRNFGTEDGYVRCAVNTM
ncbi:MAG: NADH:flavin oxidoreductase, partial [Gammaproteobacteria bacterium]|nr:NADH:flavin oxidoreductase [Gammaproteobacteria bacterium]